MSIYKKYMDDLKIKYNEWINMWSFTRITEEIDGKLQYTGWTDGKKTWTSEELYNYFLQINEESKKMQFENTQVAINNTADDIRGDYSDGYHTYNELYEFRKLYNAALFNEWAIAGKYDVHKSWKHNDGELCFNGGWFVVTAMLPTGQITNHYKAKDWNLFNIPDTEKAKYKFDNSTSNDVLNRLKDILN